jgi:hypothetical protein
LGLSRLLKHNPLRLTNNTDGDELVAWPDNTVDENGVEVAGYAVPN